MKQFGKILKFELRGYLTNKMFVGITLFLVIAIVIASFIPNIIASLDTEDGDEQPPSDTDRPVMLVQAADATLGELVSSYFGAAFPSYRVVLTADTPEHVQEQILSGDAECAFVMQSASEYTYYVNNLSLYDMNAEIAEETLREVYRVMAMIEGGLTPEQAAQILSVQITGSTTALGKSQMDNFFYTYIMIFALYMVILLYGQMVATNVATEKSSRAMEILVTSAKPTSMMFGKVLASCIAGLTQLVLVFGSALLCYNLNKAQLSTPILAMFFDIPIDLFLYMIVFFILGFLIYAFLFGAIGSTASKLEDINTSVLPITFLFIIAFMVVVFSMSSGTIDNMAMRVCSFIPFTSSMAMFTRIAMGTVAWYEIVISIAILIGSVVGIGVLSAKIYRVGVLLYGMPPKFTNIIKTVFRKENR